MGQQLLLSHRGAINKAQGELRGPPNPQPRSPAVWQPVWNPLGAACQVAKLGFHFAKYSPVPKENAQRGNDRLRHDSWDNILYGI